jgi:serpin B
MARLRQWSILLAVAALAAACTSARHPVGLPPGPTLSVVARAGSAAEVAAEIKPAAVTPDPSLAKSIATAEQDFGLQLLSRAVGSKPTGNLTVSPLSLDLALTMLENGAGGATLTEISRTLRAGSLDVPRQDQAWAALMTTLDNQRTTDQISLDSANSLWLQKSLPMHAQFMADMAQYFGTGVWQVDFAHDLAGANGTSTPGSPSTPTARSRSCSAPPT